MEREWNMDEVTDGRYYQKEDFVKAGCEDCKGCHACCTDMGNSIVLDPYDMYHLTKGLAKSVEELLANRLEWNMVDGVILPNLKMGQKNRCSFLDENGRCSIHGIRPGICRLFPLGRIYEDGGFQYFLQVHECAKEERTDVKIAKWLGIEDLNRYETFINEWHYFLKDWQKAVIQCKDEQLQKQMVMYIMMQFFTKPYQETDFYEQFEIRLAEGKELLKEIV